MKTIKLKFFNKRKNFKIKQFIKKIKLKFFNKRKNFKIKQFIKKNNKTYKFKI